jgi:hypothetical protein
MMAAPSRSSARPFVLPFVVAAFGALWGAAEGLWILAPVVVGVHRVVPVTIAQWLVLEAALLAGCAGLGTFLALPAGFVAIVWLAVRRADPGVLPRAIAIALAPLVGVTYMLAALAIEWAYFGRIAVAQRPGIVAGGAVCVALVLAAVVAHGAMLRPGRLRVSGLATLLLGVVVLGIVTLPYRVTPPPTSGSEDRKTLRRRSSDDSIRPPLLFIGIDSGNWETLAPAIARGSLPTFARLIDEGVHGDVEALWPPYWSGPAWAAILTGHPREETGVYADLTLEAPGLPPFDAPLESNVALDPFLLLEWRLLGAGVMHVTQPPRAILRRPPIWELLTAVGIESAVVRFDFTYPADGQAAFVVSSRAGHDAWKVARVRSGGRADVVWPQAHASELLAPFLDGAVRDDLVAQVLPGLPSARTQHQTLERDSLETAVDIDQRTFDVTRRILRLRPELPFMAVYLGGFDGACHAYWEYRFPEAYGDTRPTAEDVVAFGMVLDRYLEFLDRGLAELLAAYRSPPNVILVSDHGHTAVLDHPLWRGWHGPRGIFIAHGPAFPHDERSLNVSYYDVVPTIADALGLAVPSEMRGRSLATPAEGVSSRSGT